MKSALANIGEAEKSAFAARLEKAGRDGDSAFIAANAESFIAMLETFAPSAADEADSTGDADASEDAALLGERLRMLKQACAEYDGAATDAAISALKEGARQPDTRAALRRISEYLLHSDFDEAADAADALLRRFI
jgi:hypothetical protein